jgi:hypothetical protein
MPKPRILMRTWPFSGTGMGTFWILRTSIGPGVAHMMARMVLGREEDQDMVMAWRKILSSEFITEKD